MQLYPMAERKPAICVLFLRLLPDKDDQILCPL